MAEENSGSSNGSKFKTYISPKDFIPEFRPKAIILGPVFGIICGAAIVYLGLKVGLTVSASIPIAVLAISILDKIHLFFMNIFPGSTEGAASIVEYLEESVLYSGVDLYSAVIFFVLAAILFKFAMAKNGNSN